MGNKQENIRLETLKALKELVEECGGTDKAMLFVNAISMPKRYKIASRTVKRLLRIMAKVEKGLGLPLSCNCKGGHRFE